MKKFFTAIALSFGLLGAANATEYPLNREESCKSLTFTAHFYAEWFRDNGVPFEVAGQIIEDVEMEDSGKKAANMIELQISARLYILAIVYYDLKSISASNMSAGFLGYCVVNNIDFRPVTKGMLEHK